VFSSYSKQLPSIDPLWPVNWRLGGI